MGVVNQDIDSFVSRWKQSGAAERANCQLFLTELCDLMQLPRPDPAQDDTAENAYVFERRVTFNHGDGSESRGYIDLYRRDCFVLEAKQTAHTIGSGRWDNAMLRAHGQAVRYARALPAMEGRPPFVIISDVGRTLELYSEFSRTGGAYIPYPDPRSHRIQIEDLRKPEIRERLVSIWNDPLSLDPERQTARVTREIARRLAKLAENLEADGHGAQTTAAFLMRCLFTMFAEDVCLLPERSFTELLESVRNQPELFERLVPELWGAMNNGGFSASVRADLLRFNGGLFSDTTALPMSKEQIGLLIEAARADWRQVEPAIFGTLLERALDPVERQKLGAHYTPRAYVERLVMPTIMEPLRAEWGAVQAAALVLDSQGKHDKAVQTIKNFHHHLCHIRVLDPACGSGNFLYVTLEHLKRLEGEVLNILEELGEAQGLLELAGVSVDPHQLLGIETNPRAAQIAESVLWIGYLQWHFRTRGNVSPPEPVLKDFHNIECRDAVLAWDDIEFVTDEQGKPVTRWDGRTYKQHPVTGENVPDEKARVRLERYINPSKAGWPEVDYVVGNPPFIGTARMRQALGDGYAEGLRKTYPNVPESADFVMYWWHHAADLVRVGKVQRFGLITTNSLRQTFNRRVIQHHMAQKKPLSLAFAIPDHPWVDGADGAAVRIAMSVGVNGEQGGVLQKVIAEQQGDGEGRNVQFQIITGKLHADLKIGANLADAKPLMANAGISNRGMQLIGSGFIVTSEQAHALGLGRVPGLERHIREYRNGKDLTQKPRGVMVIDMFGLSVEEVRGRYPEVYQWVLEHVKPERSHNNRASYRNNWWIHGEPRRELRMALTGLQRYVVTVETCKHRIFVLLGKEILPDNMLVCVAVDDPFKFGVLSSRLHVLWALASGGRLGVGNDPRYNKSRCFETFPFPNVSEEHRGRISGLSEQMDAHRKRQQELHPDLTLTGMYNALEKLRRGEELTNKEKAIHERGLVAVLAQLHDELDAAVLDVYGWSDLASLLVGKPGGTTPYPAKPTEQGEAEEELLTRLVSLNAERTAEETRGLVRWLRPEYQNPGGEQAAQGEIDTGESVLPMAAKAAKQAWPKALPEQMQTLRRTLAEQAAPVTPQQLARQFSRAQTRKVEELLQALVVVGQVTDLGDGRYLCQ
jgi:hypothetical protein